MKNLAYTLLFGFFLLQSCAPASPPEAAAEERGPTLASYFDNTGRDDALKYQEHLKGLIISNMMSSIPAYVKYAEEVLGPGLPADVLAEIRELEAAGAYTSPRYLELVETHYYPKHVLRKPLEEWPEPVLRSSKNANYDIYLMMQGPSEFGVVGDATLKGWDRTEGLGQIKVPTLTIGAEHDTMDPKYMEMMAGKLANGHYHYCPNGAHWAMYDDADNYFGGVIQFIREVDEGRFGS